MVRHDAMGIFVRIVFAAAFLVVSAVAQAGNAEGYNAEKSGNYTLALKEYRQAAARGDASAEYSLGGMYQQGKGVPLDLKQAASWYRKAAKQGNEGAAVMLGFMYTSGKGVPKDLVQAYKWFDLAASVQSDPQIKEMYSKSRDDLKKKMTPTQIEEVGRLSDQPKGNCKSSRQISDAKYTRNLPSEASAEQAFMNANKGWFEKGLLCIESFKKTDGQKMSMFGVDYYKLEYEAVVSFPKGTQTPCIQWGNFGDSDKKFVECQETSWNVSPSGQPVKKKGEITFEKTEKGWRPTH